MASMSQLRDGLRDRLATIDGLNAYSYARSEVTTPAVMVIPTSISYDSTMARGSDDFEFELQLAVSKAWDRAAQDNLDAYLAGSGSSSIKAAIEADMSLGGVADIARVTSVSSYGEVEVSGIAYLGARITVEVTADGSV